MGLVALVFLDPQLMIIPCFLLSLAIFAPSSVMVSVKEVSKINLRKEFLRLFRENKLSKLVAAEALDEGIDIPGASVGIIVSGRASNRQYVQRIGRLLRPKGGKKAIIYELVTEGTIEEKVSRVRKQVNLNNI